MKPVVAQFAARRRPGALLWTVAACLLVAAAAATTLALHQRRAVGAAQQALLDLQRKATETADALRVRPAPRPMPYDTSARELLRERSAPWPQALVALEAVAMPGVTPVSLESVAAEGLVRVEVNFAEHKVLLDYLEALNAGVPRDTPAWRWALVGAQLPPGTHGTATLQARWEAR